MSLSLAILVSGRGSNMSAIIDAIDAGTLDAKIAVVFSNNPDAPALANAAKKSIPTAALSNRGIPREHHEQQLLRILSEYKIDYLVLAGYMRVLSPNFLRTFKDPAGFYRVINIHPSLLPAFPGAHGYEEAFSYGVRVSGITVHLVDEKVDHGPILAQATFPRLPEDDLEAFKSRGLALEHKLFPEVLQQIAEHGVSFFPRTDTPILRSGSPGSTPLSLNPDSQSSSGSPVRNLAAPQPAATDKAKGTYATSTSKKSEEKS